MGGAAADAQRAICAIMPFLCIMTVKRLGLHTLLPHTFVLCLDASAPCYINIKLLLVLQFVDDLLDYTSSSSTLGKPALNDLKSGLATAPVLYAAQEFPELKPMILRKFKLDGDVAAAQKLVFRSQGIQMTRDLAAEHAGLAADAVRFCTISTFCMCPHRFGPACNIWLSHNPVP